MAAVINLIAQGVGFSPGSVKFIVLNGLSPNPPAAMDAVLRDARLKQNGRIVTRRRPSERLSHRGGIIRG